MIKLNNNKVGKKCTILSEVYWQAAYYHKIHENIASISELNKRKFKINFYLLLYMIFVTDFEQLFLEHNLKKWLYW